MLPNLEKPNPIHENQFWFCLRIAGGVAIGTLLTCAVFYVMVRP
jgi:hypothetical protein